LTTPTRPRASDRQSSKDHRPVTRHPTRVSIAPIFATATHAGLPAVASPHRDPHSRIPAMPAVTAALSCIRGRSVREGPHFSPPDSRFLVVRSSRSNLVFICRQPPHLRIRDPPIDRTQPVEPANPTPPTRRNGPAPPKPLRQRDGTPAMRTHPPRLGTCLA